VNSYDNHDLRDFFFFSFVFLLLFTPFSLFFSLTLDDNHDNHDLPDFFFFRLFLPSHFQRQTTTTTTTTTTTCLISSFFFLLLFLFSSSMPSNNYTTTTRHHDQYSACLQKCLDMYIHGSIMLYAHQCAIVLEQKLTMEKIIILFIYRFERASLGSIYNHPKAR